MSTRKPIPKKLKSQLLISNSHACCVCGKGGVQIHHINGKNNDNRPENLAVLCLEHHDKATSPPGMSAKLLPDEILQYKNQWEDEYRQNIRRKARSRTAFFMVDYNNAERIRQIYAQLSAMDRIKAHKQLLEEFKEETGLRKEQGFNVSLEPTTSLNPIVEGLLEEIPEGNIHPGIFRNAKGHPKDPFYPTEFDGMPPSFFVYDIWCQIMIRAIITVNVPYDLGDLTKLDDPYSAKLEGTIASFQGRLKGKVEDPGDWKKKPTSQTVLTIEGDNRIWKSTLILKTHYVYSTTATIPLSKGLENGLLVIRNIIPEKSKNKEIWFSCTPLIIGSGILKIPETVLN